MRGDVRSIRVQGEHCSRGRGIVCARRGGDVGEDEDEVSAAARARRGQTLEDVLSGDEMPGQKLFRDERLDMEQLVDPELIKQRELDLKELAMQRPASMLEEWSDDDIERWALASRSGREDVNMQHLLNHVKKTTKLLHTFCRNIYALVPFIADRAKMLDEMAKLGHPTTDRFFSLFPTKNKEFVAIMLTWEDYIRWTYEIADHGQFESDMRTRSQFTTLTLDGLDDALSLDAQGTNEWSVLLNLSAKQGAYERLELFGERLRVKRVAEFLQFRPLSEQKLYGRGITDTSMFEYHPGSDAIFRRLARGFEFDATGGWKGGRLEIKHL